MLNDVCITFLTRHARAPTPPRLHLLRLHGMLLLVILKNLCSITSNIKVCGVLLVIFV